MPYTIRKNNNKDTYKVTITSTGRVVAYATKDPKKLIQAIEINKRKCLLICNQPNNLPKLFKTA